MSTSDESGGSSSTGRDVDSVTVEEARDAVRGSADGDDDPEYTPQPRELRQQQYAVGVGAAIVAGVALAVSSMQHFPGVHEAVPLVAGFLGAGLVYWIVRHSLFPTEDGPAGE